MKNQKLRCIEGTKDLIGLDMIRYQKIQRTAAACFERYGYEKIATPIFEDTKLFCRSIGEVTDIVEKEMYTFTPGSDTITLRPEGTAGVVRSFIQHSLSKENTFNKLWYEGPMFRRERPQKGRQRQFHQIGVEAFGSSDPLLDAEVIAMVIDFFSSLGVDGVKTRLNTIGCSRDECRPAFRRLLKEAIEPELPNLCKNCQSRYDRNVMRILDCKNPHCQSVRDRLPRCDDHLCGECADHKTAVEETLTAFGVDYNVDPTIVRGLDYYTKTVFEFSHSALGAQDAIGAGGRYDGLVEQLGGPEMPAVGFALGVERIMIAMEALNTCVCTAPLQIFGIAVGAECRKPLAGLLARLRREGFSADMDFEGKSFKAQMRKANKRNAFITLLLGSDELAAGEVTIKEMREGGDQTKVSFDALLATLKPLLA